jgi:Xaa-Pro aminopeptidase
MKTLAARRRDVMQHMGSGVAIIPTAPVQVRNRDVDYQFRPDSDFFYLTHFPEPEAVLVLVPDRPQGEYILFCRERDPEREIWDGYRAGIDGACEQYGADDAFPIDDIDEILPGLLENRDKVFCNMGRYPDFDKRLMGWVNDVRAKSRNGVHAPGEFVDLDHIVHEMRLFKRADEIRTMRRAARISSQAHIRAMQICKPGMYEYQVEAELLHEFRRNGSQYPAYPSIVGSGANGCILHYIENNAQMKDGDLLLIDAGCEMDGYASDITRTFPVNGKFSPEQKAIYEIVLAAQHAAIEQVRPGNHWNDPHEAAVKVLVDGLLDLKLLKGKADDIIEKQEYRKFYMHRTGHWLGMDVHDVGDYKVDGIWRLLEPGLVLTVEPGLYIAGQKGVDKRWWNIGIRIEDDVLVTRSGNEVLSIDAPKAINDIEAIMQ